MQGGTSKISNAYYFYGSILPFITGIAFASFDKVLGSFGEYLPFALALLCLLAFVFWSRSDKKRILFFMGFFLFLGIWRMALTVPRIDTAHVASFNGQKQEFVGVVVTDVLRAKNRQRFTMELEPGKDAGDEAVSRLYGRLMVYARAYPEFGYADLLRVRCDLQAPESFEGFDYPRYLAKDDIFSICYYPSITRIGADQAFWAMSLIYAARHRLAMVIDRGMSEPESGVARATMLGESGVIDEELKQSFSLSGLSHVIAISGTHITIFAAMIYFLLKWAGLGRKAVYYASLTFIILFVLIAGAPSSAVRSGIMAGLALYGAKIGRPIDFLRIILASAAISLLFVPRLLRDDIGFQLSFGAILGIFYLYPPIDRGLAAIRIGNLWKLRDMMAVTLAAQFATGGIIAYHFGVISILAILANALVLWTSAFILIFLAAAMLLGLIVGNFEELFFLPAKLIIDYMYLVADLVARLPLSFIEVEKKSIWVVVYYASMLLVLIWNGRRSTSTEA